jgi:hypothetical protein
MTLFHGRLDFRSCTNRTGNHAPFRLGVDVPSAAGPLPPAHVETTRGASDPTLGTGDRPVSVLHHLLPRPIRALPAVTYCDQLICRNQHLGSHTYTNTICQAPDAAITSHSTANPTTLPHLPTLTTLL